jgi:ribosomal-protein-alanine N-acetyltransferase
MVEKQGRGWLNVMHIQIGQYQIRDFQKDDAQAIAKYANNRKISAKMRDIFPYPYRLSDAEGFLANVIKAQPPRDFAIADNIEAIGGIGLIFGCDVNRFTAEIGYWLAEPFWNRGIVTQAVQAFVNYAFDNFDLNRIYAQPLATNPASARVLEKAGFVREGILRANAVKDGVVLDQLLYAKIKPNL